jgi:hypothetical protein
LFKEPKQEMVVMQPLEFTPGFTHGKQRLVRLTPTMARTPQEVVNEQSQGPEAEDGGGVHQLAVVAAHFFFGIGEEQLDLPAHRHVVNLGQTGQTFRPARRTKKAEPTIMASTVGHK